MNNLYIKLCPILVILLIMSNLLIQSQERKGKPKPTEITVVGVLGKQADGYFLLLKDEGKASSSEDVNLRVPEAEMAALKGKMVEIKGMGYSLETVIDKRRKIIMTSINSVKEVLPKSIPMTVVGTLTKKEEVYMVIMANKEEIEITNENKGGITTAYMDKILGRKVELVGMGFLRGGHVYTSIQSLKEPELELQGTLKKVDGGYALMTFKGEEVKLPIDEKSKFNSKTLDPLVEKQVVVKGTGSVEMARNVFTGIQSIAEPLPDSVSISVKGTLSKKGNDFTLVTVEKETLKLNLNDKSVVKFDSLEKLDGKTVEVRGKGYKKDGTHFTQIDSVKETYIKE